MTLQLLVATQNRGKLAEYQSLLEDAPIEWLSLSDVGLGNLEVAETGNSFTANAKLKAQSYCQASGLITLADDSGLVVEALGGAPGIYSARYGAPEAKTDADRYQKLLADLADIPNGQREAYFICVIALAQPNGQVSLAEGRLAGAIAHAPKGEHGFGYDPVVLLPDGRHVAELPPSDKNQISHRAHALQAIKPHLLNLLNA